MLKTNSKRCKSKRRRITAQRESFCLWRKDSSFILRRELKRETPDPVSGKVRDFITNQHSETQIQGKRANDHKPRKRQRQGKHESKIKKGGKITWIRMLSCLFLSTSSTFSEILVLFLLLLGLRLSLSRLFTSFLLQQFPRRFISV